MNYKSLSRVIADVAPIEGTSSPLLSRADIPNYVEHACLAACEWLYDRGIRTITSSANYKDIAAGHAHIFIDATNLCVPNKQALERLAKECPANCKYENSTYWGKHFALEVPITATSTEQEVSDAFMSTLNQAKLSSQPAFWLAPMSPEQMAAHPTYGASYRQLVEAGNSMVEVGAILGMEFDTANHQFLQGLPELKAYYQQTLANAAPGTNMRSRMTIGRTVT